MQGEIVELARKWIGTPYRHQSSLQGAGADCLGLVRGVWRSLHGQEPETVPDYTSDWSEAAREERLWEAARRLLVGCPVEAPPKPGDVILFRIRASGVAKHLGIAAERGGQPTFIHAYERHGVVESPLSRPWVRRIVSCFEFPQGVE